MEIFFSNHPPPRHILRNNTYIIIKLACNNKCLCGMGVGVSYLPTPLRPLCLPDSNLLLKGESWIAAAFVAFPSIPGCLHLSGWRLSSHVSPVSTVNCYRISDACVPTLPVLVSRTISRFKWQPVAAGGVAALWQVIPLEPQTYLMCTLFTDSISIVNFEFLYVSARSLHSFCYCLVGIFVCLGLFFVVWGFVWLVWFWFWFWKFSLCSPDRPSNPPASSPRRVGIAGVSYLAQLSC